MTMNRGGPRTGAGRPRIYGDPLTETVVVRLNNCQRVVLRFWCAKNRISPATLFRVACFSWDRGQIDLEPLRCGISANDLSVRDTASFRLTKDQSDAIRRDCKTSGTTISAWLKDRVFKFIEAHEDAPDAQEESLVRDVLDPDYPMADIQSEIRKAGGDPIAIGRRGAALAKSLLEKRRTKIP